MHFQLSIVIIMYPKWCYQYIYVPLCLYPLLSSKYSSPIRRWEYSLQPDIANQERHRNVDQPIDAAGPSSGVKTHRQEWRAKHKCDNMGFHGEPLLWRNKDLYGFIEAFVGIYILTDQPTNKHDPTQ